MELAKPKRIVPQSLHPHTHAVIIRSSSISRPRLKRLKVVKPYSLDSHHYDEDKPAFHEIKPGHAAWANMLS